MPAKGDQVITILLNGEAQSFPATLTLQELLQHISLLGKSVAVALNSEIIPKSDFEKTALSHEDRVEIIHPVGGG